MSVAANSRYNYCVIMRNVNAAGHSIEHDYLDIRPSLVQTSFADNQEYAPGVEDTWSRIAWKRLGNGRYYWIIADYSDIIDPFSELQPEVKERYVAQLGHPARNGETVLSLTSTRRVARGMQLRVENMDPNNPLFTDTTVLHVDTVNNAVVTSTPLVIGGAGEIPVALARVVELQRKDVRLVVPAPHRALFEALDFTNPLNTLVT